MFLFGVLWLILLAAELAIAHQFLKTRIRHHWSSGGCLHVASSIGAHAARVLAPMKDKR